MTGVEILSSETIYNTFLPPWWLLVGLILGATFIILAINLFIDYYNISALICLILAITFIIVACLSGIYDKNSINHIEYKVTIDDSVSMTEFMDKYEILDQEGKIYTVKEKE